MGIKAVAIETRLRTLCLGAVLGALGACAGGPVPIETTFPQPVVDPLPYRVGVFYSPEFNNYVYTDEEGKVEFELGSKQRAVYDRVFQAMFADTVALTSIDGPPRPEPLDVVLEPVLDEYGFLTPAETATKFYSVSLKYHIRLYQDDGTLIGYWPFVAYGKDRKGFGNNNVSLGEATTLALRDAAAAIISQFGGVLKEQRWKQPKQGDS